MNTVGKILTVLIFVMSAVYLTNAVMVYAPHKNWKKVAEEQKKRFDESVKTTQDLASQIRELKNQRAIETAEKQQQIAKLNTELNDSRREVADMRQRQQALEQERATAVATVQASQQQLNSLFGEVERIRKDIRDTQQDRDVQFTKVVELMDQIHAEQNKLEIATERRDQLAKSISEMQKQAKRAGVNLEAPASPPLVAGKVLAVNSKEKLVEVSVGSDDGIAVGSKLQVYRGSHWLAQVEVLSVKPDRAVAKVMANMQKAPIQKDDNVATKFKNDVAMGEQN